MASQLYKVLTEIDSGRKAITDTIKRKGYGISSTDSLMTIASSLEEHLPQVQPTNGVLSNDGTVYYNNPEEDPEVWTEYKQWPNIYDIYHNAGILTYNDVEYYPASAFLFRTDLTEILYDNKNTLPFADNKLHIDLGSTKSILVTPSNTVYPYGSNFSIQLTNADKITGKDGKTYYYIIHYIPSTHTSARIGNFTIGSGANIHVLSAAMCPYNTITSSTGYGYSYGNTDIDFQLLYLTNPSISLDQIESYGRPMKTAVKAYPDISLQDLVGLKAIICDIEEHPEQCPDLTATKKSCFNAPNLNTIVNTNKYIGGITTKSSSVVYYKTPSFCSASFDLNSSSAGSDNYKLYINSLKYLIITDEEAHKEFSHKTCYCDTNTTTFKKAYYGTYPYLSNGSAFKYCTKYATTSSFRYSFRNIKHLHINYLTWPIDINGSGTPAVQTILQYIPTKEVTIHGIEEVWGAYFLDVDNLDTVIMPDAKRLSASSYGVGGSSSAIKSKTTYYIKKLILPQVTEIFSGYSSDTLTALKLISHTLTSLHLPSLQRCSSPQIFQYCLALKTLEVGEDWETSLSFVESYSLSKESILDLFNKLKTLTEEEIIDGRTITLPTKGPASLDKFTQEEIAIATNKGWVIA